MSPFDFFASLVSSLAWPAVVVTLALTFREQLKDVVGAISERIADMSELSGPGSLNAKFEKGVREVTDVTSKLESPIEPDQPSSGMRNSTSALTLTSPRWLTAPSGMLFLRHTFLWRGPHIT